MIVGPLRISVRQLKTEERIDYWKDERNLDAGVWGRLQAGGVAGWAAAFVPYIFGRPMSVHTSV
jgi:hypothetical protein